MLRHDPIYMANLDYSKHLELLIEKLAQSNTKEQIQHLLDKKAIITPLPAFLYHTINEASMPKWNDYVNNWPPRNT